MNETVNKFLLAGDKFNTCVPHDMAYGDFTDLPRKVAFDKILREKAFDIARNAKCDEYNSMV